MNLINEYLLGKGKVSLCERDANGAVSKAIYTGNAPEFKISMTNEKVAHNESYSGVNTKDREIVTAVGMDFSLTLESITKQNIALLTWGTSTDIEEDEDGAYTFGDDAVVVGDTHVIPNAFRLSDVTIVDSTPETPVAVDVDDYDLDADFGTITFNSVAGYTQPFVLSYTRGAAESVPFFTERRPTRFIRFEGLNLGNPGLSYAEKYLVEIYLAAFEPSSEFNFLSNEFAKFELKGTALLDDTRSANSALGGFGRMIKIPQVIVEA